MDCSDLSNLSNASLSFSGQTINSVKTKTADYKDNVPNYDVKDKYNIEALQKEENKDSNVENKTERKIKIITLAEFFNLTSKESSEKNTQSLNQENPYKKRQTASLFNKMTIKQWNRKLLEIILISIYNILSSNQDLLNQAINKINA